jgi:TolB protein
MGGVAGLDRAIVDVRPDGSERRELATGEYPGASRDGSRIWFTRGGELWRMAPDGAAQQRVALFRGSVLTPAESPDGSRVAFTYANPSSGSQEVWVVDADGSDGRPLATASGSASARDGRPLRWAVHPSWSADGRVIAFASTQSGRSQVWTMSQDGSQVRRLIDGSGDGYPDSNVPEYSPDGGRIAYWSGYEAEYGEVWTMDAEGRSMRRLTDTPDPMSADNPSWSPDGSSLVFISNRDGSQAAWVVAGAGGEPRRVLGGASYCAWRTDAG